MTEVEFIVGLILILILLFNVDWYIIEFFFESEIRNFFEYMNEMSPNATFWQLVGIGFLLGGLLGVVAGIPALILFFETPIG